MFETIAEHWSLLAFWLVVNATLSYGVSHLVYRHLKKKEPGVVLPMLEHKPDPVSNQTSLKSLNVSAMKKEPRNAD